jgi:4'-phosphopantetheinyl transferase
MTEESWHVALADDEIHVWRINLVVHERTRMILDSHLSVDERNRVSRFEFGRDRQRHTVARGAVRLILARYLMHHPAELRFRYGEYGKPELDKDASLKSLNFNVSHSADLALCAVGWNRSIGVDLEQIRDLPEAESIVKQYFSAGEAQVFLELKSEEREAAFFACWTRKEAYLKARGAGLQIPLDGFEVTLSSGSSAGFVRGVDRAWNITDLITDVGFSAALAYNGGPARVIPLNLDECPGFGRSR